MPADVALDPALATRLLHVAGITGNVDAIERLAGGMGSDVFALRVNADEVVVKIYPEVARASMHKQLWVCEFLAHEAPSLPIPRVLAVDESGSIIPQAFSVLSRLPGIYLRSKLDSLTETDLIDVYVQIGSALGVLHEIELSDFGEVMPGRGRRYTTNQAFMRAKFEEDIATFGSLGGDPRLHGRLTAYFEERQELLRLPAASFCHNDGHDANMLVRSTASGWLLTGILDFEHALAGDPLFDLAKTFYFAPSQSEEMLGALTNSGRDLNRDWRAVFATYLTYHQLALWNLLAGLGVADRLPAIAEQLDRSLAPARS